MPISADALLFDLGRVVIDIDFELAFARWAAYGQRDPVVIRERFTHSEAYKRHERGEIEAEEYFAELRSELGIEISDEQLLDGWNAIFIGEMPGISPLLIGAARQFSLFAFSNSNREHELCWSKRFANILGHFAKIYVSSTIGLRKPDPEAYEYVVKAIGAPAERIAFFDDNVENIEGARACGLQAFHVRSSVDVANALATLAL
jgi:glucose-1-phosphatase